MLRKRRSACIAVAGVTIGLLCLWILKPGPASGQQNFPQPNRRPACTCFCGDSTFNSFPLFSSQDIAAGKCFGGPLPADVCSRSVKEMPAEQRREICRQVKATRQASCPAIRAACDDAADTPKSDCPKPVPWFDPPSNCKDVQKPVVAINNNAVTVSVCGFPIFRRAPEPPVSELALEAYQSVISGHIQQRLGSRICCDAFRESAKTGKPCFPAVDVDCDGVANDRDTYRDSSIVYPDINLFTTASNAKIDEFPSGLDPDDPNFLPGATARQSKDVGECPCKWELTSGKLTCSRDGRTDHVYTATWKCPANGKEVFTTKYAKATQPCRASERGAVLLPEFIRHGMLSWADYTPYE